jgi:hypothetical protein
LLGTTRLREIAGARNIAGTLTGVFTALHDLMAIRARHALRQSGVSVRLIVEATPKASSSGSLQLDEGRRGPGARRTVVRP